MDDIVWSGNTQVASFPLPTKDQIPAPAFKHKQGKTAWIYVWSYPSHKAAAKGRRDRPYLCKVGYTNRDPRVRVVECLPKQLAGLPEVPVIDFLIETAPRVGFAIEQAIFDELDQRKRTHYRNAGEEWFKTTPEEVLEIYRSRTVADLIIGRRAKPGAKPNAEDEAVLLDESV